MDTVNGCNKQDLTLMNQATRQGEAADSVGVSPGCRATTFTGKNGNYDRKNDIPLALNLVDVATSDVLNMVSFFGGVSFLF
jgi:hypothetical protein